MERRRSVRKLLMTIFCTMLTVTVLCLALCGGYAMYTAAQDMMSYNQAALDLCLSDLTHTMKDLEKFNEDVFLNDLDFISLSREGGLVSTNLRIQNEFNLRRLIQSRTQELSCIMLFSADNNDNYYWLGSDFMDGRVDALNTQRLQAIRTLWLSDNAPEEQSWVSYDDGHTTLMMNTFRRRNLYICAMVDIGAYAERTTLRTRMDAIEFAFLTRDGVLTNRAYAQERGITFEDMLSAAQRTISMNHSDILQTRFDEETGVGLCGMISLSGLWRYLRVYTMVLVGSLLVVCLLFLTIYHLLNQMVVYPLNQITEATRQIAEGASSIHSRPEPTREFAEIQTALGKLVEQKVSLANENARQRHQKEHALLQYYQLQTRSHFFLNCLKSIHGLTVQGEREKTIAIIGLFSNHLRYVFHDSLTFVTVGAELGEVHDYFGIIVMERSDHILMEENVDPSLTDFPVPPLIIQTFLENFNKHNVQSGKILRFCIHIDRVELEDREYVRIRMTDNGVGYSEEALQSLQNADGVFERYHVGVQNLCRRMDILYQGQYQKAFYNNPGGGALSVFYLPISEAAPENSDETKGAT